MEWVSIPSLPLHPFPLILPFPLAVPLQSFNAGKKRTAKLTSTAQLQCMGKLCAYAPQVVQCRQTGHDGLSPQWACEADLPEGLRFGALEVVCEGWSRPGDTDVLAGSCALEYELEGRPEAAFGSWAALGKQKDEHDCESSQVKIGSRSGQDRVKTGLRPG